jgi:hypothetical protein
LHYANITAKQQAQRQSFYNNHIMDDYLIKRGKYAPHTSKMAHNAALHIIHHNIYTIQHQQAQISAQCKKL